MKEFLYEGNYDDFLDSERYGEYRKPLVHVLGAKGYIELIDTIQKKMSLSFENAEKFILNRYLGIATDFKQEELSPIDYLMITDNAGNLHVFLQP